ncbi:MAG: flippase [Erysipelotrichaceae bacterium]|nr:flippase [Erysipelotrichaceae bacterium]
MNSIKKNFLYNTCFQILQIIIPLITTPYISRVLGADGIGSYSYYYTIAAYFVLFILLGLNNYGNREIARIRDDRKKLSSTFWNIYTMQLIMGILVSILYIAFTVLFAKEKIIAFILMLYIVSGVLDINWFYFGMEQFKLITIRNSLIKILTTVLIFLLVKSRSDLYVYTLIMAGGMLISQAVMWLPVFQHIDFVMPSFREIVRHIRPNCVLFITVIAVSVFKMMDKIMLGAMSSTQQVGFYESAEKIILIPQALITSLGTVMLPRMSNIGTEGRTGQNLIRKSLFTAMLLSSVLSFGIISVARDFVPLFYGPGFEVCISLYYILLPSCLFLAFANVIRTQYLLPAGMDRPYVVSAVAGAVVNFAVNYALIPSMGAVGAALATTLAEIIVCLIQVWAVRNRLPVAGYVKMVLPGICLGILMCAGVMAVPSAESELMSLILKTAAGGLICVLGAALLYAISSSFRQNVQAVLPLQKLSRLFGKQN